MCVLGVLDCLYGWWTDFVGFGFCDCIGFAFAVGVM